MKNKVMKGTVNYNRMGIITESYVGLYGIELRVDPVLPEV